MDNTDKKTENTGFHASSDLDLKRNDQSIDVNKYIHTADEEQIGLDIFEDSSNQNNLINRAQRSSVQTSLPESVRKKLFSKEHKEKISSRSRMILISAVIFVLITGIGLGTVFAVVGNKSNRIDVNFRYSTENKEVGTVKNTIKRESKYAYGIYYPFFGKETIDKEVEEQNSELIGDFLSKYKRYSPKEKGNGAVMFSDYSATDFVDYYQIVRKTEYKIPDGKTSERIYTLFYDIKNDKIIKGSDFFDSTFKQIVSVKIENYLKDNTKMSQEEIETITDYQRIRLDNFSLDSDYLYLYVDDSNGSTITVKLSLDSSITGHFKISYKTLKDYYDLAHQSV